MGQSEDESCWLQHIFSLPGDTNEVEFLDFDGEGTPVYPNLAPKIRDLFKSKKLSSAVMEGLRLGNYEEFFSQMLILEEECLEVFLKKTLHRFSGAPFFLHIDVFGIKALVTSVILFFYEIGRDETLCYEICDDEESGEVFYS